MKIDELKQEIDGMAMELENKDKEILKLKREVNYLRVRNHVGDEKLIALSKELEIAKSKLADRAEAINEYNSDLLEAQTHLEFMTAERNALKEHNGKLFEENKRMYLDLMHLAREAALYSANEVGVSNAVEEAVLLLEELNITRGENEVLHERCDRYIADIADLGGWITTLKQQRDGNYGGVEVLRKEITRLLEHNTQLLKQVNELNSTSGDQEIKTAARVIRTAFNLELNVERRGSSWLPVKYVVEGTGDTDLAKSLIDAIVSLNRESKAL